MNDHRTDQPRFNQPAVDPEFWPAVFIDHRHLRPVRQRAVIDQQGRDVPVGVFVDADAIGANRETGPGMVGTVDPAIRRKDGIALVADAGDFPSAVRLRPGQSGLRRIRPERHREGIGDHGKSIGLADDFVGDTVEPESTPQLIQAPDRPVGQGAVEPVGCGIPGDRAAPLV